MKIVHSLAIPLVAGSLTIAFCACNDKLDRKQSPAAKAAAEKETDRKLKVASFDYAFLSSADTIGAAAQFQTPPAAITAGTNKDWDKKIIRTASLSVEVKNYKAFNDMLRPLIKQDGGYIAQEEQVQDDYRIENNIVIKVPVDQFENAVQHLTATSGKITEKKITSEDVTGEYVDTKSDVVSKKKVRDRYLELLKLAKNIDEVLQVQQEINNIEAELEGAAGRIEYLGHASAFSTINLRFFQVINPAAAIETHPSFTTRVGNSFQSGMQWIGELLIVFITLWPLWLALAIVWFLVRKYKTSLAKNSKQLPS